MLGCVVCAAQLFVGLTLFHAKTMTTKRGLTKKPPTAGIEFPAKTRKD